MIDLDELERLHQASTQGEWEPGVKGYENCDPDPGDGWDAAFYAVGPETRGMYPKNAPPFSAECHKQAERDAALICAAHNLMPAIIAELRQARMVTELLERCSEFRFYQAGADWYASATIDGWCYAVEGDDQAEAIDDLWQQVRKAVKR